MNSRAYISGMILAIVLPLTVVALLPWPWSVITLAVLVVLALILLARLHKG